MSLRQAPDFPDFAHCSPKCAHREAGIHSLAGPTWQISVPGPYPCWLNSGRIAGRKSAGCSELASRFGIRAQSREPFGVPYGAQSAGEKIQLKGKIRRILALDAFPRQPQCGLAQEITSPPNSSIASCSESEPLEHFRWRLISWPPLGHSKTNR